MALDNDAIIVSNPLFPAALHNPPNAPAQVSFWAYASFPRLKKLQKNWEIEMKYYIDSGAFIRNVGGNMCIELATQLSKCLFAVEALARLNSSALSRR